MSGDAEGKNDQDSALRFEDDEAADFADRVNEQIKDSVAMGDDTDELEDFYGGASGKDVISAIDRARNELAQDPSDAAARIERITGRQVFGEPRLDPFAPPPTIRPEPERVPGKEGTVTVAGAPFVSGGRSSELAYSNALDRSIGRTPRIDREGDADTDIFESDLIKEAQAQGMAQYGFNPASKIIEQARQIPLTDDSNFPGIENVPGRRTKQSPVSDGKLYEIDRPEMGTSAEYFNYLDLNKDGKVSDAEGILNLVSPLLSRASDIQRRMNIGPKKEDGTAAIPGVDFEYKRTESGAIDPTDPNYMGSNFLDYEGGGSGFGAYSTPDSIASLRRDMGDDGGGPGQPLQAKTITRDPCPEGYKFNEQTQSCEYTGVVAQGATSYAGDPLTQNIQYTGVAGLSPFVLQPTYTGASSFSPLYNVG